MSKKRTILAIESSCDDTSVAVVKGGKILSNLISSQYFHKKYSGIVPELASRAHIQVISRLTADAMTECSVGFDEVDAIAVTSQPGLIGSLIVGSNFAKGLAVKYNLPIVPVNHIEGHIFSGCLQEPKVEFPIITLVVSGGHTALFRVDSYNKYKILGLTRDDAAGEAFDKIAALLGLGYPGGPVIDKLAKQGNPKAYDFPRSMIHDPGFDFSFSGLKTSVRYFLNREFPDGTPEEKIPDICASVQAAIVDVLVAKTIKAANKLRIKSVTIAGGVSANSQLRSQMKKEAAKRKIRTIAPDMGFCMDNAAMIGFIAEKKFGEEIESFRDLTFVVNPASMRAERKKKKRN